MRRWAVLAEVSKSEVETAAARELGESADKFKSKAETAKALATTKVDLSSCAVAGESMPAPAVWRLSAAATVVQAEVPEGQSSWRAAPAVAALAVAMAAPRH